MKPTYQFDETLIDNISEFNNEFFKRFELRHAPEPIKLNEAVSKNYLFPTFYDHVTCAIGIFFCNYEKAQALLPSKRFKPVSMLKNRSVVIFSCYEYKKVSGIPGYNEIAMTIPMFFDREKFPPVLPLLKKGMKGFGYHVFSMPVTSYENQLRGLNIWGLPKVVEQIDIKQENGTSTTQAYDQDGKEYFRLKVPMAGKEQLFDESGWIYSVKGNKILKSETNFKGNFNVKKFTGRLLKVPSKDTSNCLYLGDSERAKDLRFLEINPNPLQFRHSTYVSSCFDLAKEEHSL